MTAHGLIADIFGRAQPGLPGNMRRITAAQLKYLRDLIDQDEEGNAARRGDRGSIVWMPSGRWKYVLTEDTSGREKHTLTKLGNLTPTDAGRLF